jgi:hypothetical protein
MIERRRCRFFVMGFPRSGTNEPPVRYLAVVRGICRIPRWRMPVYQVLIPRFGSAILDRLENRKKIMAAQRGFRRSGLDGAEVTAKVLENCRSGDFLNIVMGECARKQQVVRWAVYSPDTVAAWRPSRRRFPKRSFVHIIRDGCDIALSLRKLGDFNPFPWSHRPAALPPVAASSTVHASPVARLSFTTSAAKSCLPRVGEGELLRKWAGIWGYYGLSWRGSQTAGGAPDENRLTTSRAGEMGV